MAHEVQFRHQQRQSLAMKVTPDGVVVLLPSALDADSPQVRTFVQTGLRKLPEPQSVPPDERLSPTEVHALVADWSERIGVTVRRVQFQTMRCKQASCCPEAP